MYHLINCINFWNILTQLNNCDSRITCSVLSFGYQRSTISTCFLYSTVRSWLLVLFLVAIGFIFRIRFFIFNFFNQLNFILWILYSLRLVSYWRPVECKYTNFSFRFFSYLVVTFRVDWFVAFDIFSKSSMVLRKKLLLFA